MPRELIFTSVPSGLKPGSTGYCTVARHEDMDSMLERELERLSLYEITGTQRPVIHAFRIISLQSGQFYTLSRISYTGSDHTGRTNYLAQHLVFDESEIYSGSSPVDYFIEPNGWLPEWPAGRAPEFFRGPTGGEKAPHHPATVQGDAVAPTWEMVTGHPRNAYSPAHRTGGEYRFLTSDGGHDLPLRLIAEYCAQPDIGPQLTWRTFTFTTFLQSADSPDDFKCIAGTNESAAGKVSRDTLHLTATSTPETCFQAASAPTPGPLAPERPDPTQTQVEAAVAPVQDHPGGKVFTGSEATYEQTVFEPNEQLQEQVSQPDPQTEKYTYQRPPRHAAEATAHPATQRPPSSRRGKRPLVLAVLAALVVLGGSVLAYWQLVGFGEDEEENISVEGGVSDKPGRVSSRTPKTPSRTKERPEDRERKKYRSVIKQIHALAANTREVADDANDNLTESRKHVHAAGFLGYRFFETKSREGQTVVDEAYKAADDARKAHEKAQRDPLTSLSEKENAMVAKMKADERLVATKGISKEIMDQLQSLKNLQAFALQPHEKDDDAKIVEFHFGTLPSGQLKEWSYCEFLDDANRKQPKDWQVGEGQPKQNLANMAFRLVFEAISEVAFNKPVEVKYYFTEQAPAIVLKRSDFKKLKKPEGLTNEETEALRSLVRENTGILDKQINLANSQYKLSQYLEKQEGGRRVESEPLWYLKKIINGDEVITVEQSIIDLLQVRIDKLRAIYERNERDETIDRLKGITFFKNDQLATIPSRKAFSRERNMWRNQVPEQIHKYFFDKVIEHFQVSDLPQDIRRGGKFRSLNKIQEYYTDQGNGAGEKKQFAKAMAAVAEQLLDIPEKDKLYHYSVAFEKPTQIEFDTFMTVLANLSQMLKTSREASYQPLELKRGQKVLLRMLP